MGLADAILLEDQPRPLQSRSGPQVPVTALRFAHLSNSTPVADKLGSWKRGHGKCFLWRKEEIYLHGTKTAIDSLV